MDNTINIQLTESDAKALLDHLSASWQYHENRRQEILSWDHPDPVEANHFHDKRLDANRLQVLIARAAAQQQ